MYKKMLVLLCLTCDMQAANAAADELDWSQVKLSVGVIQTSLYPNCLGYCSGYAHGRGSKVRLTFPPELMDIVRERLGGDVSYSYFQVRIKGKSKNDIQKIYFDAKKTKKADDGRCYFERSSNQGRVLGAQCQWGELDFPPRVYLNYVQFWRGSKSVALYLQEPLLAPKRAFGNACGGPFATKPVKVPDWAY